jgi:signal transduction histidine kinase
MLRIRDLSFRYKIPLRATLVIWVTASAVSLSLMVQTYRDLRGDVVAGAQSLGRVLAETLIGPVVRDDVWRAFEIVNSPARSETADASVTTADHILVLDGQGKVFVSTQPERFPMMSDATRQDAALAPVVRAAADTETVAASVVEPADEQGLFVVTPILADGVKVGTLVMHYPASPLRERFLGVARRAGLITLVVLAVLLPVTWFWGARMAEPLVSLAECMGRVGRDLPKPGECEIYRSRDELGRAGDALWRMIEQLQEKQALERRMMLSDRLAAVGRLSAGIAHEINNPLGGMLNAISTFKRHGNGDPMVLKTMSLLERGLQQIRETVGALLVEAKVQSRAFSTQDIEDVRTLIEADAEARSVRLAWASNVGDSLPLPSTMVRQLMINLLLNALHAVDTGGCVECQVTQDPSQLTVLVCNDGHHIEPEQMEHLFEPFVRQRESGYGLGLWVSYQIVQQLGGRIEVASAPGDTRFAAHLPLDQT